MKARYVVMAATMGLALLAGCGDKKAAGGAAASAKPGSTATSLTPQATPIKAGQPFTVAWTGPNGADDYVDIVRSGRPKQVGDEVAYVKTAAGNPAKLTAPDAGSYDVRYVQDRGERTVIAHVPIQVVP